MMKKLEKLLKFENFILEERSHRSETIESVVKKLKREFGDTNEAFLETAKKRGIDHIQQYIVQNLQPYLDQVERPELFQTGFDYDGMLTGLVSWLIVEMEVEKMKKANKKEKE